MSRFAVVVPVYNGRETLGRCLAALQGSATQPSRVVVVDDCSIDGSGELAASMGAEVIRLDGGPFGPAVARNRAGFALNEEIVVFVDADVEVHPDSLARLVAPFSSDPRVAAAFGSYDDDPDSRRLAAQYGNLRHHFVHQQSKREAHTFWSGFGAIRREVMISHGGFDERYGRPSIEDIELGLRLHAEGWRIALVHEAQAKHLKDWSLGQLWKTDVFRRAIPWSRLLARQRNLPDDLNVGAAQRASAVIAHLGTMSALAGLAIHPAFLAGTGVLTIAWAGLDRRFLTLLARRGGVRLLAGGAALHWAYYLYSSVAFGLVWLEGFRRLARDAQGQAAQPGAREPVGSLAGGGRSEAAPMDVVEARRRA